MDLAAYFERIGYTGDPRPDLPTLRALHLAHSSHIPFENLDIQMGLPISLEVAALEDKLVRRRRGGYCFEHNSLFQAALRQLGFEVVPFEARVRLGATEIRPRTHMILRVALPGRELLADVGFGGGGLLGPVPTDGALHEQFGDAYRIVPEGQQLVLQWQRREGWLDMYAFVPEARPPIDFVVANHYTSTHPSSAFVQTLTVQLPTPEARYELRNFNYRVTRGEKAEERSITQDELLPLLRDRFGLVLATNARLRIPLA